MKQVFLSGQGQVDVIEAPVPQKLRGGILVRNAFSLISTGTEGAAVTQSTGVKGLYEKAINSSDKLGQVWNMAQNLGLSNTVELIKNKLGDYTPLGYCSSGVVLEVENEELGFKVGQRVACMGTGFANHAEYVAIPRNLAVVVPDSVPLEQAAFSAIACIGMQGIRRLELSPGESVAIVGLGLIGQITLRLATAMGYRAYGFDIDDKRVNQAAKYGNAVTVINSATTDPVAEIASLTVNAGIDGVVLCASSKSNVLINQTFEMCRRRGRVSVVGDIGLGLQRAKMYAKELEVRLSCSYGVGRYDREYELEGHDYPLPYVRWTERRNLEFFINLLAEGRLDLSDLITSKIGIGEAKQAYSLVKSGGGSVYGVLLDYLLPEKPELPTHFDTIKYEVESTNKKKLDVGLIGVGAYARNIHVPNLLKISDVEIRAVASKTGSSAAVTAKKVKASYATSNINKILEDEDIDAVVISTRHSSHAELVIKALKSGKDVFVEKPMATKTTDCLRIIDAQNESKRIVRVGFNRRFSPMLINMKKAVGAGQKVLNARINVGNIGQHWSNTLSEGGRLVGEGVHFFDLATWLMDSKPVAISAQFVGEPGPLNPDASISIRYENGSVANINYVTLGNVSQGKEFFELYGNGRSVVINDYKNINAFGCRVEKKRSYQDNKGQKEAMEDFVVSAKSGHLGQGADALAGLWATAISEAAIVSGKTGTTIILADFIERQRIMESDAEQTSAGDC
ncbi:bi-domain-containing oxidoreductase [Endozoicomonas sp. ALB032]|uniref:bi-domain-containing oxidoreductase n=1 Tax=Endozoicomonas sp. ALB032 TaxID=3403082 RepID=UPI003BB6B944